MSKKNLLEGYTSYAIKGAIYASGWERLLDFAEHIGIKGNTLSKILNGNYGFVTDSTLNRIYDAISNNLIAMSADKKK